MNAYALLAALVIVTAVLMKGYREGNKKYVIAACLMLFAVYGLRDCYSIGNDSSSSYLHLFQRLTEYTWEDILSTDNSFNIGYRILNKAVSDLSGGNYQVFITLIAAFVTFCFGLLVQCLEAEHCYGFSDACLYSDRPAKTGLVCPYYADCRLIPFPVHRVFTSLLDRENEAGPQFHYPACHYPGPYLSLPQPAADLDAEPL